MKIGWKPVLFVGFFAAAGLILCWYMLSANSDGAGGMLANKWFCGSKGTFSYGCSGVFASRYGKFMGIPLPGLGAIYFGTILVWILVFGRASFNFILAGLLSAGAMFSLFLLYILFFVLPGQCRWCILTHSINGLIIAGSISGFYRSKLRTGLANFRQLVVKILLVGFILLSATGWSFAMVNRFYANIYKNYYVQLRQNEGYQRWLYDSQPARKIPFTRDEHIIGPRSASVKIIMYKDFQCPACREAWGVVKKTFDKLYRENPGSICLAVRDFPQSNKCNKYWRDDSHPFACSAAQAAEAVSRLIGEDGFWEYHKLLVENSDKLDEAPYLRLAEKLGIPKKSFLQAFREEKNSGKVKRDIESAKKLNI